MGPFIPPFLGDVYSLNNFKIGILGSITFLGSALLGVCLGRVGDKWTKAGAVSVSMILCCISTGMLISFSNFFVLAAASFLMGASYITWSLLGAVIGSIAPEGSRARWISIPQTASMLASFLAPYLGGALYGISPYNPFLVAIATTPLLAILVLTKQFSQGTEKD
ncbi:MAG: MFS transporter [Thermoproteota archaeon]|nr:MFS transporter [Thermoproteota archaeon]